MRILLVEDDVKAAAYLEKGLGEAGFAVDVAHNGIDGDYMAREGHYELFVLDVMLPGLDGWQLLSRIRVHSQAPVLFLTARDAVDDRVRGLQAGADDYLVKPFSFAELLARARTLLRRAPPRPTDEYRLADLQLDLLRRRVQRAGQSIALTAQEFALLHLLIRHPGEVLTRAQIASQVWGMNFDSDTNVVDVAIRRLRVKIDDPFPDKLIRTVRGVGYTLEAS